MSPQAAGLLVCSMVGRHSRSAKGIGLACWGVARQLQVPEKFDGFWELGAAGSGLRWDDGLGRAVRRPGGCWAGVLGSCPPTPSPRKV
jgi:hypothetical protein